MNKDIEKTIRETWFKDHKATLTKHGDLQVLSWRKPGTSIYAVRYVFDGSKMYISGDVGDAIFCLTWKADVHSFNNTSIDYFEEKLRAFSDNRRDYSSEKAVRRLREWLKELKENEIKYDNDLMRKLFDGARGSSTTEQWAHEFVNNDELNDFISSLDVDYWEWMYRIGDEIPCRIYGYLIGLQMASEQLKGDNINA